MLPFAKTVAALFKARLWGLMIISGLTAIIIVVLAITGITWIANDIIALETGWIDLVAGGTVGLLTGIGGWFMLPVVTLLVAGLFQEQVILAVEKAYYPGQTIPASRFWPDLVHDLRFTALSLTLNLCILPLYFLSIGFFISIALNSYLIGREFFESAAGYRLGKPAAKQLGRQHQWAIYSGGLIITLITLIPVINLFAPILGITWMVHLYHSLPQSATTPSAPETDPRETDL